MRRLLPALLLACGAALPPPERALCYANADHLAQERVDAECKDASGAVHFASCPTKDAIMADLRAQQEACK